MKIFITTFAIVFVVAQLASFKLSAQQNSEVTPTATLVTIEQVLFTLDNSYVYPSIAGEMRQQVNDNILAGHYQNISSNGELIKKLQRDLREISNDGHISLHLATESIDRTSHIAPASDKDLEVETNIELGSNSEGRIGYLRFNKFSGNALKQDIAKAMQELSTTSSLIIDLRYNGGGDPNLVAFLSAYFLPNDTPLWSIIDREGNTVIEVISNHDDIPNEYKYTGRVGILISQETYSAAEAFTYTLQHLKRVIVIGEASGGGAHLVEMQRINDEIDIRIPVARAYNPNTKSNWEGMGVTPDIKVSTVSAINTAVDYFRDQTD